MNGISSIALPLEETGLFSSIFIDFIEQRQWLDHFQLPKPDLQGLLQVAQDAEWEKFDRKLLLNTLTAQYRELEESGTVISEAVKTIWKRFLHLTRGRSRPGSSCTRQRDRFM